MTKIARVGVDIAKSVFHVHGVDRHGQVQWQAKLKRNQWLNALCARLEPGSEVGMEACAGAHHWARELQQRGYQVKLIAAQFRWMSSKLSCGCSCSLLYQCLSGDLQTSGRERVEFDRGDRVPVAGVA